MRESISSGERAAAPQKPSLGVWTARAIAALVGIICFAILPPSLGLAMRAVAAWDLAVLVLVVEGWYGILRSDPERSQQRAVAEDPGRLAILAVSFGASLISLVGAIFVIGLGQSVAPETPIWLRTALGLAAIVGAWTLLHTAFTLHYARLYYGDPDSPNCITFHGGPPDDSDFAYLAFGIGMTFQVPDVRVNSRSVRRVVLMHEVISFAYNTAILALIINLIAGRL
jgi:uncharacterized membrane protein